MDEYDPTVDRVEEAMAFGHRPGWPSDVPWRQGRSAHGWLTILPAVPYARFRAITQYGDPEAPPTVADVVVWLSWVRRFPEAGPVGLRGGG